MKRIILYDEMLPRRKHKAIRTKFLQVKSVLVKEYEKYCTSKYFRFIYISILVIIINLGLTFIAGPISAVAGSIAGGLITGIMMMWTTEMRFEEKGKIQRDIMFCLRQRESIERADRLRNAITDGINIDMKNNSIWTYREVVNLICRDFKHVEFINRKVLIRIDAEMYRRAKLDISFIESIGSRIMYHDYGIGDAIQMLYLHKERLNQVYLNLDNFYVSVFSLISELEEQNFKSIL